MDNIVNIEDYKPHEIAEVICLYCMNRWISVHEQGEWLAKWECPKCGKIGGIIYIQDNLYHKVLTTIFKYVILYT